MARSAAIATTAMLCALLWLPSRSARADNMDLALSRLRIVAGRGNCPASRTAFCPDQELFERLVSELAVAMAPPINAPARSLGGRALGLSIDTTLTTIEAQRSYWVLGTEGDGRGDPDAGNRSPESALVWTRVQARKGLPFGLEAAGSLAQGVGTPFWTLGLALKWALFEGFHSGLGRLPDVAVQGSLARSVGSNQISAQLYTIDLTLSKPFIVEHTFTLSPFTGVQTLFTRVQSGRVDLTPDKRATENCSAGGQPMAPCLASDDLADLENDVTFKPVNQTRVRMFLGGQARYEFFTFSLSALFDLSAPTLSAPAQHFASRSVAHQLALSFAVGAVL